MTLTPGTRLGPYEIVAPLGAGGMGEVYRARDTRLGRDVAVKTLPAAFARDAERRSRFETEARAVAALSHPNVLAIHDLGAEGDTVYAVMELIEGQTLREMLTGGPLPGSRAVAYAIQIARGLAAAHDRGVIHRDLKPENVMITPDGHAKILDFGLARRVEAPEGGSQSLAPTAAASTEPGTLLGTTGYMSPEQVRGLTADVRSDIFALGALMYEMISGRRAFHAASPADTMSAILREDPTVLVQLVPEVPPAIDHVVRRCLEKLPGARFRSAADLAYALEAISLGSGATPAVPASPAAARTTLRRITYRNGHIVSARFTPDGASSVFTASWEGGPNETFSSHPGSPEARHLGLPHGTLLAMSPSGDMAFSVGHHHHYWLQVSGTLARVPLAGGGVRQLQKDVGHADWSVDGRTLAMTRYAGGRCRLEYPAGRVLFETSDWLSCPRVSPDGRHVAFAHHPYRGDSGGDLCLIDSSGTRRVLLANATSITGIAWSPGGGEVCCSGLDEQMRHGIWGVRLEGGRRELFTSASRVTLHDIARDGRMLVSVGTLRVGMHAGAHESGREVDLAWFDGSVATDLSADGRQALFSELDEAENPHYACYLRDMDGSPAVRLGEGTSTKFSPDGGWVLAIQNRPEHRLCMYPVGIGEPLEVVFPGIDRIAWAGFHPDGRHLFAVGSSGNGANRLHRIPIGRGMPEQLIDEDLDVDRIVGMPIAPDGDRLVLPRASGEHVMFSCAARAVTPIAGLAPGDQPVRFDGTGRVLFVSSRSGLRHHVERLDLASGERQPWRDLEPPDRTGVLFVGHPIVGADGSAYAYSFLKTLSDLYVVEGLL